MKKVLLSAAVASTLSLASYGFADGPIDSTIYGKVNVSVVNADTGSTDQWKLNSNSSRLGVKGKTEIADGLYAVYKAEFEIAVDDGDTKGQTFTQRNIMAGIRGSFGTVWVGKHDSPTKLAQNKIDLFNDLEGDIKNTFEGENRVSNIVAYTSPNINGFATTVAMMPGEGADLDGDGNDDTGLTDGISYSVSYTKDNLYIAVAGDQDVLGAIDESGFFVSAAYSLDSKTTLKAQYGSIENDVNGDDKDSLSLGADYKLAKGTKLYVFYTDNEHAFVDESKEKDVTAYGLGMEHKF
jgi:predicted porin